MSTVSSSPRNADDYRKESYSARNADEYLGSRVDLKTDRYTRKGNRYRWTSDAIIRASLVAGHPEDGPAIDPLIIAWREASVRLALQLPTSGRIKNMRGLVHPKAWKNLRPSEKAGVNNSLGNTVTKLGGSISRS